MFILYTKKIIFATTNLSKLCAVKSAITSNILSFTQLVIELQKNKIEMRGF